MRIVGGVIASGWTKNVDIMRASSTMLKKSASGVLALVRGSRTEAYASPLRSLRPCWTDFLSIVHEYFSFALDVQIIEVQLAEWFFLGMLGDERRRYSKKVFILSKKPSLSSSIDMPLSLANSWSNSF